DLAVHVTNDFRSIEVGYTFRAETWGNGYAVESVAALIERLWEDRRLLRVYGMLHPANRASAQVLERVGMKFEGHTRLSFWGRGEGSDDWIYGMTREDWERWRDRPTGQPTAVALVAITSDNQREVAELETHHSQRSFVAPVRVSYGDALFPGDWDGMPVSPWMRAITADDEYAGFVMMHLSDDGSEPYLWRFLIDRNHQRRGIGRRALDLVVDACRTVGANSMRVSWVPGRGSPEPFYLGYGFEPTGVMHDTELEARLRFPDFTR
ncbi:MAG: GNAT family N-acetyltransferase, partial [Acidimicrobiia bacterium]|nr:GNAT family N-acetyltransferase [Acidimicrobiia bacterium]